MKFFELNKSVYERSLFDCGEPELNRFIRLFAAKHMKAGISTTMLLPYSVPLSDGKYPVRAFYTIAPGSISRKKLPAELAAKLLYYPVPVYLLAQMAVDLKYRGMGLGKITLIRALEHIWAVNSHMRAYAVVVDCLNRQVEQFYLKYGFEYLHMHDGRTELFLPMNTLAQLFGQTGVEN
jgi:GNAT superfamily N-acetyltransferase